MRLRWERVIALISFGISFYLLIKLHPFLRDIFRVVNDPFGYDSPIKAIMLAVLCLTFLAGIKLMLRK